MTVKRVIELKPHEVEAFKIIGDISCSCDNCDWCPFCHKDAMGSECLIDIVTKAFREGSVQVIE